MKKLFYLIVLCIIQLYFVIPSFGKDKEPFYGEKSFEELAKHQKMTIDEARIALRKYLTKFNKTYAAFPEEVAKKHKTGYLFIEGDFKHDIPISGYFVDGEGKITYVDLNYSITVKDYMKRIDRKGWFTPKANQDKTQKDRQDLHK